MKYKLINFDMDGTLIYKTTAHLFYASILGCRKEMEQLEAKFSQNEISYSVFANELFVLFKELNLDIIDSNFLKMPKISRISETIEQLRRQGFLISIITSSGVHFANSFLKEYELDYSAGSIHKINNGYIGESEYLCTSEEKVIKLKKFASSRGISMKECISVGDSFTDVGLFINVGMSIALNAKTEIEPLATKSLTTNDLTEIISFIE